MPACSKFEELLLRDLDGELSGPERGRVREHLAACAACKRDREYFGRIDDAVRKSPAPSAPRRDFVKEALDRAQAVHPAVPRRTSRRMTAGVWASLGIAAVVLFLGATGVLVWYTARPIQATPPVRGNHAAPFARATEVTETLPRRVPLRPEQPLPPPPRELLELFRKELKFEFTYRDPVEELTEINLALARARTDAGRLALLRRAFDTLVGAIAIASAHGYQEEASAYGDALEHLFQKGLLPLLDRLAGEGLGRELGVMSDEMSQFYQALLAFARALPAIQKPPVERILAFCAEGRDASRRTARRLGAP